MNEILVDRELTPENCKERGFEWWADTIYDPEAPVEVNKDFIDLINDGWKLGRSASVNFEDNGGVGVYKLITIIEEH